LALIPISRKHKKSNTAVIFHLFYPELWDETRHYLENLNQDFDFYVSIPDEVNFNLDLILQIYPRAIIYRCANRGRDIAPFLKLFSLVNPLGYEYICKIHTKKSLHRADGSEWRTEILDELLGSDEQIQAIKQRLRDEKVGIIGPRDHIISTRYFFGGNQPLIDDLSNQLGLGYSGEYFNFIAGSMFWFKPQAIAPVINLGLCDADFPEESGQVDATLAHALERVICLLALKHGYQVIQTGTFTSEANDAFNYAIPYKGSESSTEGSKRFQQPGYPEENRKNQSTGESQKSSDRKPVVWSKDKISSLNSEQYYELTPSFSDAILRQVTSEPTQKPDIIYFPFSDWDSDTQQPQELTVQLAERGYRVFFVHPIFSQKKTTLIRKVGQREFLLRLPCNSESILKGRALSLDDIVIVSDAMAQVSAAFNIHTAIVMVDHPAWQGLALQLCDEFSWKLVYHCRDEGSDPASREMVINRDEQQLLLQSDLVMYSSSQLQQKFSNLTKYSILLPGLKETQPAFQEKRESTDSDQSKAMADVLESALNQLFPKISIIVVTFNKIEYTKLCLESILNNTEYPNYEIIIVDNASVDGTVEYLEGFKNTNSYITFIRNDRNLGFAAANNLGARSSSGDYLVLLNNDTIVTPGWLHRLVIHLKKYSKAGMVGSVTNAIGNEAKIQVNYTELSDINYFAARRAQKYNGISFRIRVLALYCAMISRDLYEQLGGLDERYYVGMFEDDDLALKIQHAGFYLQCAEDVFIHHFHGASFNQFENQELQRIFHENRRKFEDKWDVTWQPHKTRPNV
jgi:GT2 family glycosyltransferase